MRTLESFLEHPPAVVPFCSFSSGPTTLRNVSSIVKSTVMQILKSHYKFVFI